MKVLFVDAYYTPEITAFSHLENDLIEGIIKQGHTIEIITPIPTRGITDEVFQKYKSIKNEALYDGRVQVRRFWAPREGKNPLVRAFRYFWCNFREYQIGKKYKNIDVVFCASTPPTQGLLAGKLSKKLKCPFVYSLQDVFPDSLVSAGLARKGSVIWKIGRFVEKNTYKNASQIVVISESCKNNLLNKGVDENKITLISNWVDTESIKPVARENNKLIFEYGIDSNKFLVVYAGNLGEAQGADVILRAAEKLIDYKNIQFVIFGGGADYQNTVDYVKEHNLSNVIINPLLPQERVSEVYSLGDIALITCKAGVGNSGLPSKTWSIMACNTPIVASFDVDSDLANIMLESKGGICIEAGNSEKLANEILKVYNSPERFADLDSRNYIKNNADKKICIEQYLKILDYYV